MPQHQSVCLHRRIEVFENWHDELSNYLARDTKQSYGDEVARCVFWMRKEVETDGETVDAAGWSGVELEGEIHLEKSLLPSFKFPVMSVEVSVPKHQPWSFKPDLGFSMPFKSCPVHRKLSTRTRSRSVLAQRNRFHNNQTNLYPNRQCWLLFR